MDTKECEKSAVLVVDMSNDFVNPELRAPNYCEAGYHLLDEMSRFIEFCRKKGMLIIYTTHTYRKNKSDMSAAKIKNQAIYGVQHVEGTPGIEIHEKIVPKPEDIVIRKHYFSGFYGTELNVILKSNRIQNVYIIGVTTDVCCLATARDAQFENYHVTMVENLTVANKSRGYGEGDYSAEQCHQLAINSLYSSGIDIMRAEEIMNVIQEERRCLE